MPSLASITYGNLPKRGEGLGDSHDAVLQYTQQAVTQLARAFVQPQQVAEQAQDAATSDERTRQLLTALGLLPFEVRPDPIDVILRADPPRLGIQVGYLFQIPGRTPVAQRGLYLADVAIISRQEADGSRRVLADFRGLEQDDTESTLTSTDPPQDRLTDPERDVLARVMGGLLLTQLRNIGEVDLMPRFAAAPRQGMQVEDLTVDVIEHAQDPNRSVLSTWLAYLDYENMGFGRVRQLVEQRLDPVFQAIAPGGGAQVDALSGNPSGIKSRSVEMKPVSNWELKGDPRGTMVWVELRTEGNIAYTFQEASGVEWTYIETAIPIIITKNLEADANGRAVLQFQTWNPGETISLAFQKNLGNLSQPRQVQAHAARKDLENFCKGLLKNIKIPIITHQRKITGLSFLSKGVALQDGVRVFLAPTAPRGDLTQKKSHVPAGSDWALALDARTIAGQIYDLLGEFSVIASRETQGKASLADFRSALSPGRIEVNTAVRLEGTPVEGSLTGYLAVGYDQEQEKIQINPHLDIQIPWWVYVAGVILSLVLGFTGMVGVNPVLAFLAGATIGIVIDLGILDAIADEMLNTEIKSQTRQVDAMLPAPETVRLGDFTLTPRIGGIAVDVPGITVSGEVDVLGRIRQPLKAVERKLVRGRSRRRPTFAYRMENGALVPTQMLMDAIEEGLEIPGIHLVHCKDGRRYLRSNPDSRLDNNLSSLPTS